jgi:hypothetical protein
MKKRKGRISKYPIVTGTRANSDSPDYPRSPKPVMDFPCSGRIEIEHHEPDRAESKEVLSAFQHLTL